MPSSSKPTRNRLSASTSALSVRRAQLTAVEWAALLAPGALAGATLAAVTGSGRTTIGRLAVGAGAGAAVGAVIARGMDEVQWRRRAVTLAVDEPDAALDLMQAVRAEGVQADMVRADDGRGRSGPAFGLRYRAKDDRTVRAVFAEQQG